MTIDHDYRYQIPMFQSLGWAPTVQIDLRRMSTHEIAHALDLLEAQWEGAYAKRQGFIDA